MWMEERFKVSISTQYGGYGGVDNNVKYIPPTSPSFIPHPSLTTPKGRYVPPAVQGFIPQPASVPYTIQRREELKLITDSDSPLLQLNNLLLRTRTDNLTGVTDRTFAMITSGDPGFTITYTMPASSTAIDLFKLDGGYF